MNNIKVKVGKGREVKSYAVKIERDSEGFYIAEVPAIKGCHSQGKTKKEVIKNIKEAIELCLGEGESK